MGNAFALSQMIVFSNIGFQMYFIKKPLIGVQG